MRTLATVCSLAAALSAAPALAGGLDLDDLFGFDRTFVQVQYQSGPSLTPIPDQRFSEPAPSETYYGPSRAVPPIGSPAYGTPTYGSPVPSGPFGAPPHAAPPISGPALGGGFPAPGSEPIPYSPGIPLYHRVKYKDLDEAHPFAVKKVVFVPDPCTIDDPCAPPSCVAVEICVPPCGCEKIDVDRHGREYEYDYGKHEVDVRLKRGYIEVDYQD